MDSFGKILYSDKFSCNYMNIPSPSFMKFREEILEQYRNDILPLIEKLGNNNE